MSVIVQFSLFPMDKGESISASVAPMIDIVERSGLPYQLGPMGTCIEGEWPAVMETINACFQAMTADSSRVYLLMAADYRKNGEDRMSAKVESVEKKRSGHEH